MIIITTLFESLYVLYPVSIPSKYYNYWRKTAELIKMSPRTQTMHYLFEGTPNKKEIVRTRTFSTQMVQGHQRDDWLTGSQYKSWGLDHLGDD